MFLTLTDREIRCLRAFLDADEDCEALSEREYVADLYDLEAPVSLDLVFAEGGVRVDGASLLAYDDALDGYYLSEPVAAETDVRRALIEAGALPAAE